MWQVLGLAHRKLDDLGPAAAAFDKAAALAPHDPLIAHRLARAQLEAGFPPRICSSAPIGAGARWTPRSCSAAPPPSSPRAGSRRRSPASMHSWLSIRAGWTGHASIARLRWLRRSSATSFHSKLRERSSHCAARSRDLARADVDTLMQADLYEEALAAIARGRAAAGANPGLRRARGGLHRRKRRDRPRPTGCSQRWGRSSMSPWRRATCATCCAPAGPRRRSPSATPGDGRDPGQSPDALSGGGLAADRRSALGNGWRATSAWSASTISATTALARRAGRAAARRSTSPATSRSSSRCAAAPRPTGRCSPGSSPRSARFARHRRGGRAPRRAAAAARRRPSHPDRRGQAPSASPAPGRCGSPAPAPLNHVHPAGLAQLGLLRRLAARGGDGRRAPCRLAHARRAAGRARPRSAAVPPGRAEARPAGPLPLDDVARHPARSRRASG